jgi:hypothetical protein
MPIGARWFLIVFFAIHFLCVGVVCCRDTFWIIGRGLTVLGAKGNALGNAGESFATAALGEQLARTHWLRQSIDLYLHAAGIESGYGFFAPNVGSTSKLVFELHFADGKVEYQPAVLDAAQDDLRLASFLDSLNRTNSERLRNILIRSLAEPLWSRHPTLVKVRAILGTLSFPTPAEIVAGKGASYQFVTAFELTRPPTSDVLENH